MTVLLRTLVTFNPRVFLHLQGQQLPPAIRGYPESPPSSFRLWTDFKVSRRHCTGWIPVTSWVSSLSAPSLPDVTETIPTVSPSTPRFSQPPGRYSVRDSLRVCSTPQAPIGSGSSEFDTSPSRDRLRSFLLLRRFLPFTASFRPQLDAFHTSDRQDFTPCGPGSSLA